MAFSKYIINIGWESPLITTACYVLSLFKIKHFNGKQYSSKTIRANFVCTAVLYRMIQCEQDCRQHTDEGDANFYSVQCTLYI